MAKQKYPFVWIRGRVDSRENMSACFLDTTVEEALKGFRKSLAHAEDRPRLQKRDVIIEEILVSNSKIVSVPEP